MIKKIKSQKVKDDVKTYGSNNSSFINKVIKDFNGHMKSMNDPLKGDEGLPKRMKKYFKENMHEVRSEARPSALLIDEPKQVHRIKGAGCGKDAFKSQISLY